MRIAVLNGPNLDLLGIREPDVYGSASLEDIEAAVRQAVPGDVALSWQQTNHEGEFVELIHRLRGSVDGIVLNAAAYTHSSLAIRDALLAVNLPFVEIHMSNVFAREEARRVSLMADIAVGVISGFGADSYRLGVEALLVVLRRGG